MDWTLMGRVCSISRDAKAYFGHWQGELPVDLALFSGKQPLDAADAIKCIFGDTDSNYWCLQDNGNN